MYVRVCACVGQTLLSYARGSRSLRGAMPCRDCGCAVAVPWAILLPGGRPQLLCSHLECLD